MILFVDRTRSDFIEKPVKDMGATIDPASFKRDIGPDVVADRLPSDLADRV